MNFGGDGAQQHDFLLSALAKTGREESPYAMVAVQSASLWLQLLVLIHQWKMGLPSFRLLGRGQI
jgi:hypothetical protein